MDSGGLTNQIRPNSTMLPCQGPLSCRKDIPLHHFHTPERPSILHELNAYPLQGFILWEMSHGVEELTESCLGWQRDLRDPEFRMYIGLRVHLLT